ncbi:uncharacterized protein N7496_005100 [Penicillium cataractarum]|uniref:Uncharacterized protein n=1 Tax=Penicillium cataractarum TaxID=2100454 RepID=A0A9W9SFH8_9EURO|nr:uncharacterized protein N7496_005100 [Penicillium cataractarum]KAJ5377691.1 hypothetical protein N7496_005100 [Penicillium cataractarum]
MNDTLARRDDTTCEGSKQWYVCSAGNFRGCCASDPCSSGICFDDNVSLLHLTSAASSTTSTTSSKSTSTTTGITTSTVSALPSTTDSHTSSSTSVSSNDTSAPAATTSTESSTATSTATATSSVAAAASTGTHSPSKGPIIGGVVAAIAALILIILLFWLCRRRRKILGKSYTFHLRRSPSTKSLHNREMASVSKTELSLLETNSVKLPNESPHNSQTTSPPSNPNPNSNLSTPGSTTALSLNVSNFSPDPSEFSTLSSGVLTTSSGGFVRLPPLRMPSPLPIPTPPNEIPAPIPKTESQAAELSDTGFYRQRAELAAHSQSELINIPPERRRRNKSTLAQAHTAGHSWESSPSSSNSSGSSESSPRSAVDKNGSSTLITRATARRVVTRDGVVMGANLDRYSTIRDPERGGKEKGEKSDSGQDHVMSFMTFGGSEVEMVQRVPSSGQVNGLVGNAGENVNAQRLVSGNVLQDVGASPIREAPPAYDAGGVSPKQDEKSPSGTIGLGINRRG